MGTVSGPATDNGRIMMSWRLAILIGFLLWLITFVVSMIAFPLKKDRLALFESIMPVALSIIVVVFSLLYLRKVQTSFLKEGLLIGGL